MIECKSLNRKAMKMVQKRVICVVMLLLGILHHESSFAVETPEEPFILKIFDQFVYANLITSRCAAAEIDAEMLKKHLSNFQTVHRHTVSSVKELRPDYSDQAAKKSVMDMMKIRESTAEKLIEQHGCEDKKVRLFVDLFKAQAQWEMSKINQIK